MNIEDFIDTIEKEHLEKALDKLKDNPEKLIGISLSALEYRRAKLMRANAIPETDEKEKDIKIEIIE